MSAPTSTITEIVGLITALLSLAVAALALLKGRAEQKSQEGLFKQLLELDRKIAQSEVETREWVEERMRQKMSQADIRRAIQTELHSHQVVLSKLNEKLHKLEKGERIEDIENEIKTLAPAIESPWTGSSLILGTALGFADLGKVVFKFFGDKSRRRDTLRTRLLSLISIVEGRIQELQNSLKKLEI